MNLSPVSIAHGGIPRTGTGRKYTSWIFNWVRALQSAGVWVRQTLVQFCGRGLYLSRGSHFCRRNDISLWVTNLTQVPRKHEDKRKVFSQPLPAAS